MKDLFRLKKAVKTCTVLVLIMICSFNLKSQDDKITGIYVDGVKVTEIDCYNFGDMTFYLKYSDVLKNFKILSIAYFVETNNTPYSNYKKWDYSSPTYYMDKVKFIKEQANANAQMNSGYIKVDIFKKGERFALGMDNTQGKYEGGTSNSRYPRECLMYDINPMQAFGSLNIKKKPADPNKQPDTTAMFTVKVFGFVETGKFNEYYDEYTKTFKREPELEGTLIHEVKIKLNNRKIVVAAWDQFPADVFKFEEGYTCNTPKGDKFSDLLSSESKKANTLITNSTDASNFKSYTEKYKNGKVKVQGQNNKDGNQEGTWKYFNELGKLERVENYKNGISHGEWKYYDVKTGKVIKTEKYNEGELIE